MRRIGPDGTIMTVAGDGTRGFSGDGGPATAAQFGGLPADVAVDAVGKVYIVDSGNHRIRRVDPNGIITTFAGDGELGFPGDGGPATEARLDNPTGVAVDSLGNVYIADGNQRLIRRVTPDGVINSVAGNDLLQDLNDGGLAIEAKLELPEGVFVDARGVIYIADTGHQRVRRVTLDGVINTIAGNGLFRFNGDGGPAVTAALNGPNAITTDRAGNLFISDFRNQRIRRVSPDGLIDTYAGSGASRCCSNYGGPATGLGIFVVHDLAVDPAGNLLIVWKGGSTRSRRMESSTPSSSRLEGGSPATVGRPSTLMSGSREGEQPTRSGTFISPIPSTIGFGVSTPAGSSIPLLGAATPAPGALPAMADRQSTPA